MRDRLDVPKQFKVTAAHIRLIRDMRIDWDCSYSGAPAVSIKQPYNAGQGAGAVLHLVGEDPELDWHRKNDRKDPGGGGHSYVTESARQQRLAMQLHRETHLALQVVLQGGDFSPGLYERLDGEGYRWRRIR